MLEIFGIKFETGKVLTAPDSPVVAAYIPAAKEGKKEADRILKNK